jgi:hypothetical protein
MFAKIHPATIQLTPVSLLTDSFATASIPVMMLIINAAAKLAGTGTTFALAKVVDVIVNSPSPVCATTLGSSFTPVSQCGHNDLRITQHRPDTSSNKLAQNAFFQPPA